MSTAFWDASALIPLCTQQESSSKAQELAVMHQIVAWWGTPAEMTSAINRLMRMRQLHGGEYRQALREVTFLRRSWREISPTFALRECAEAFLARFPLRAADSLQLAAAWIWTEGAPLTHTFISGDVQLLDAAAQLGFTTIQC